MLRGLARGFGLIALLPLAYLIAALGGSILPANAGWRAPATGMRIFIEDNGVHTGIAVPKDALGPEWRVILAGQGVRDRRHLAHPWLAIGWGDRAFYIDTPTWRDLSPATALAALVGSDRTVLHVEHIAAPVAGRSVRAVTLRPAEFARLQAALRDQFAPGAAASGYAGHDVFHPARGHYDAIRTCNAWTAGMLRRAGVRVGRWTPFSFGVMWWF